MNYIYVIGGTEKPYKIGITNNLKRRLKDIQTGHPFKLQVHYSEEIPIEQVRLIELNNKTPKLDNITVEKAVFVGTTAELLKKVKAEKNEDV